MNTRRAIFLLTVVATLAACGEGSPPSTHVAKGTIVAEEATWLPDPSRQSWRDYADEVAIVRVTAEHRIEATDAEVARGEYWIGRKVDFTIERNLWTSHSTITAPSFTAISGGWMYSSDPEKGLRRVVGEDNEWMAVGGRYVSALIRQDNGEWFPWSAQKITGSTVASGEIDEFVGATPDQVAASMRAIPVSPAVAPYVMYSAKVRAQLVTSDRAGEAHPTPMPSATTPGS
jgi:hypothetical protein